MLLVRHLQIDSLLIIPDKSPVMMDVFGYIAYHYSPDKLIMSNNELRMLHAFQITPLLQLRLSCIVPPSLGTK